MNRSEISSANGTDIDSTPDTDQTNDCFGGDNVVSGNGKDATNVKNCSATTDEDDHDPAEIIV